MKSSIYEYKSYKRLFVDLIESDPSGGRGKRKALAESLSCQVSHVTNVLSGEGHFNAEQTHAACMYFGLNHQEIEYVLLLVQQNRAGTTGLKKFYDRLLQEKSEKNTALKNRLKMPDALKSEQEALYYQSWHIGAVHVLLSIPEYQTRESVATKLGLSLKKIDDIFLFLVEVGLIEKEGNRFKLIRSQLHLDKSSPLITKHHTNWRLRSLLSFDEIDASDLHYSSVFTLSDDDYQRVREILSDALTRSFKLITESPEEQAAVICLDLFRL